MWPIRAFAMTGIEKSEVLTPADQEYHHSKSAFTVPFVCGCCDLGEAAAMLRTKASLGKNVRPIVTLDVILHLF